MNLKPVTELVVGNIYYLKCFFNNYIKLELIRLEPGNNGSERAVCKHFGNVGLYQTDLNDNILIPSNRLMEEDHYIPPIIPKQPIFPDNGHNSPPAEYQPSAY